MRLHIHGTTFLAGAHLSRRSLLEGHTRFDLNNLRAFGTKCHFLLTLQKKGGHKMAVQTKGELGIIMSVDEQMPAYRVWDVNGKKVRNIPMTQLVTHEGHYPFRAYNIWSE